MSNNKIDARKPPLPVSLGFIGGGGGSDPQLQDDLNAHIHDYNNPHRVNKAQLGLPRVENMSSDDIIAKFMSNQVDSGRVAYKRVSDPEYTVLANDFIVICIGETDQTITLPSLEAGPGKFYIIINESNNSLMVNPHGSEYIDGNSDGLSIDVKFESVYMVAGGESWYTI